MTFDLSKLPVLVTATECARLLGLPDGRRLNVNRKPTHVIYLHGKPTGLYPLPLDTIYASRCVNSPNRPEPIAEHAQS
jgi:hypothetical protein